MTIVIPGEPVGKQRPRVVRNGGVTRTYTPEKTASYENLVKVEYERQAHGEHYPSGTPVSMKITACFALNKGDSKRKRDYKLRGVIRPTKKPDIDNVIKVIADALNGLAYDDDSQIVTAKVYKVFGETPSVTVTINEEGFI